MKKLVTLVAIVFTACFAKAQSAFTGTNDLPQENTAMLTEPKQPGSSVASRINFFVITKEKSKKFDFTAFSTVVRAKIRGFFDRKTLYVLIAASSEDAAEQISRIVEHRQKKIGNIWFDSHGHYRNRYSSFHIGRDEFSHKNINDTAATKYLQLIASYCDEGTKIGLGACYAGASFDFPATDSTPVSRMNGDSLMIGLGNIFHRSLVYASEGWVMAKPGIFSDKFGLAGYPLGKRYLDSVWAPVWEHLGEWREYSARTGELKNVPTISLNRWGDIRFRDRNYQDLKKAKKTIAEKMSKLKSGVAKFS